MASKKLRWKLPLRGDPTGQYIYDASGQMIAQIRGWGHLTGQGGLRLSDDEAIAVQSARLEAIVSAVNAASGGTRTTPEAAPPPAPERPERHGYGCPRDGEDMLPGEANCPYCCRHGWVAHIQGEPCPRCWPHPCRVCGGYGGHQSGCPGTPPAAAPGAMPVCVCGHSCLDHAPARFGHDCQQCGCDAFRRQGDQWQEVDRA